VSREPYTVGAEVELESGGRHLAGVDDQDDRLAASAPDSRRRLDVSREVDELPRPRLQTFSPDGIREASDRAVVQRRRWRGRLVIEVDCNGMTLARADAFPRGVEGESLFVVLTHDPLKVLARDRLRVSSQRVKQDLHVDVSFAVQRKPDVVRAMAENKAQKLADVNVSVISHGP
jgi:hypothetical protein